VLYGHWFRFLKNILEKLICIVKSRLFLTSDIGFSNFPPPYRSRDNAVGIATAYGLEAGV
jgi:hypothetical protein